MLDPQAPRLQVPAPQPFPTIVVSKPVLIWYAPTTLEPPFPLSDDVANTYVGLRPVVVVMLVIVLTVRASI